MNSGILENKTSKIASIEAKVDRLVEALEKCLGIKLESDLSPSTQPLKDKCFHIPLADTLDEVNDFDVALETLNQKGNERGIAFKKGRQRQEKGAQPYEKYIICKMQDRNKEKRRDEDGENKKSEKTLVKDIDCPVFYRFRVDAQGKIKLLSQKENHNHSPNFYLEKKLTPQMIKDISCFSRLTKVSEVRDYLEIKYNTKLDYLTVYQQYRKFFPRFNSEDCQKLIDHLIANDAKVTWDVDIDNKDLCKLIFSTKLMMENYRKFGEVLLIDTTYNTNYLSVPLVVFSGVDNHYRNILFGIGLIDDESAKTYEWLIEEFNSIMNRKYPFIIISDQDLSLCSAIKEKYKDIPHRYCIWHIARNLRKQFRFINSDYDDIKQMIFQLPYLYSKEKFNTNINLIIEFLKQEKYDKNLKYLENLLLKKNQWARSHFENNFDADISTTSRVESWNAVIKQYLNSRSEISAIIEFIRDTELCYFAQDLKVSSDVFISCSNLIVC